MKTLVQEGAALSRYLYARKEPLEENEVHKKRDELERNILQGIGYGKLADVRECYYRILLFYRMLTWMFHSDGGFIRSGKVFEQTD